MKLEFLGAQPYAAYAGAMDGNYYSDYDHLLWAIRSTDGGATWGAPMNIPSDPGSSMGPPISLAVGSHGQAVIGSEYSGGSSMCDCGQPKLTESDDNFANWKT